MNIPLEHSPGGVRIEPETEQSIGYSRLDETKMIDRTIPDYYRRTYERWYGWFSYIYDPFVKLFLFVLGEGFDSERKWRESIIEWLSPLPGENILDICSGTGTLSIMLGKRLKGTGTVVGIEVSADQLRITRKKKIPDNVSFIGRDAQSLPYQDCHFDRAVICGALHEMPQKVRRNVLGEAYRVIKPDGSIVVAEHNKPVQNWKRSLFDLLERLNPEYKTYRDLLECGLTNEIERAGFKIVKTETRSWGFFQMVLARK